MYLEHSSTYDSYPIQHKNVGLMTQMEEGMKIQWLPKEKGQTITYKTQKTKG